MAPVGSPSTQAAALRVGDGVDVWRVDLHVAPPGVGLGDDERRRAARLHDDAGRARFAASRAWLRVVLGRYLGTEPAAVRFSVADRGKPSLVDGGDLAFSLSRSGGVALIAVTRGRPVGVDVEEVRSDLDHDELATRFFSPAEADSLRNLPEHHRRSAFFGLWVRKEAVLKATGAGLSDGIGLDVRQATVGGRWSVASLDVGRGWAGAVAVDGALRDVHLQHVPGG